MNTLEVLIAARKLIEKPENWTRAFLARDNYGDPVYVHSDKAVCFCAMGALHKAVGETQGEFLDVVDDAAATLASAARIDTVAGFNDTHTHDEVLVLFDKAIEMEKAK